MSLMYNNHICTGACYQGNIINGYYNGTELFQNHTNSQPAASITINYIDDRTQSIVKSIHITGIVGNLIQYSKYTDPNQIPNGYNYDGLGQHTNVFLYNTTDNIMVKPISEPKPRPVQRSIIYVIYRMPNGRVIRKHRYNGHVGENFNSNHYKPLPGYKFKKIVIGGNGKKFGKRPQTIIMQML